MNLETQIWNGPKIPREVIQLRYEILRKPMGGNFESARFDGDDSSTTWHFVVVEKLDSKPHQEQDRVLTIVGCASLMLNEPPGIVLEALPQSKGVVSENETVHFQLRGMAIATQSQGLGIGRMLLETIHRWQDQFESPCELWCNARSVAIPFYRNLGWLEVGEEFLIPNVGPHKAMFRAR